MASKEAPSTPQLYSRLDVLAKDGDYEAALPLVEKILQRDASDVDALRSKTAILIHKTNFKEALNCIKSLRSVNKSGGANVCVFEEAYCLYRMEKYQDSWKVLLRHPDQDSPCVKELQAQLNYRMENYGAAAESFYKLIVQLGDDDGYSEERTANAMAATALGWQSNCVGPLAQFKLLDTTFEQCFNSACFYLAMNDGAQAEKLLTLAEKKCRESLQEDDYTEDEIEEELCIVRLQLGCAYFLQGKNEQATQQFSSVLKQKPDDAVQTIVASNNIIVINRGKDIFDSKKRVKALSNEPKLKSMTSQQRLTILYNRFLFALHMNQLEQSKELLKEMNASFPDSELCLMANLALLNREKKSSTACIEKMQEMVDTYLAKHFSVNVCLLRAQLPLINGSNLRASCNVLQQIPNVSQYLGVVSVLVSFLTQLGDSVEAMSVLDTAVEYWTKQQQQLARDQVAERSLQRVVQANAQYKLARGEHKSVALMLEKLYRHKPDDTRVLAQLINAYSKFDPAKAEEYSKLLPTFQHAADVDVTALEQVPQYTRKPRDRATVTASPTKGKSEASAKPVPAKKKSKRKPRLPKNYNPSAVPDPERWLPLRERSYYKRGKKKGFVPVGRGTQGLSAASSKLASLLDNSAKSGKAIEEEAVKSKPAAPAASAKKKPQPKKKKKGKGW